MKEVQPLLLLCEELIKRKTRSPWDKGGYPTYLPYEICRKADREAQSELDNRRFCYGLIDLVDDEILSACKECVYYVENWGC